MSEQAVRAALETRLLAWAADQVPPLAVALQNVAFTAPASANYLRAYLMPAQTISRDYAGAHRDWRGIFQVTAVCMPGNGPGHASAILAALDALFPVNLVIVSAGLAVKVLTPASAGVPQQETTEYEVPISIGYHAQLYPD